MKQSNKKLSEEFVSIIAYAGDLSMGQPVEHSPNVAFLAFKLATALGLPKVEHKYVVRLALMRWAGCTANARGFSDLFGDDIKSRVELMAGREPFIYEHSFLTSQAKNKPLVDQLKPLAQAQCEAMALLSDRASIHFKMSNDIEGKDSPVNDLFENWDGTGVPLGKKGRKINLLAQIVSIASDLEIFSREYGIEIATKMLDSRKGKAHCPSITQLVINNSASWLSQNSDEDTLSVVLAIAELNSFQGEDVINSIVILLSDYAALKVGESINVARESAIIAEFIAKQIGLSPQKTIEVPRACLLHRIGFVTIPNHRFNRSNDIENLNLAPYWSQRILSRSPTLAKESQLASLAFERLDGSGYFRQLTATSIPISARVVQAAVATATRIATVENKTQQQIMQIIKQFKQQAKDGLFDIQIINSMETFFAQPRHKTTAKQKSSLTPRELAVVSLLAKGYANKKIASELNISAKTVNAHLENIYKKLSVTGRTAATMKALEYGWLS